MQAIIAVMNDLLFNSDGVGGGAGEGFDGAVFADGGAGDFEASDQEVSGHDTSCFHLMSRLCDGLAFLDEIEPSGAR
jgi:hypothetical protein